MPGGGGCLLLALCVSFIVIQQCHGAGSASPTDSATPSPSPDQDCLPELTSAFNAAAVVMAEEYARVTRGVLIWLLSTVNPSITYNLTSLTVNSGSYCTLEGQDITLAGNYITNQLSASGFLLSMVLVCVRVV